MSYRIYDECEGKIKATVGAEFLIGFAKVMLQTVGAAKKCVKLASVELEVQYSLSCI